MNERSWIGRLLLRLADSEGAATPVGRAAMEWATQHAAWLTGADAPDAADMVWLRTVADEAARHAVRDGVGHLAESLAAALALAPADARLLEVLLTFERGKAARSLARAIGVARGDVPALLGALAEAGPVRASPLLALGLFQPRMDHAEGLRIEPSWRFEKLLDAGIEDADSILAALVGAPQMAALPIDAFAHLGETFALLRALIAGAVESRAPGVNILIHGPAGTGKTELARTLAAAAGVTLIAVGEADEDGDEPARDQRIAALRLGQRVHARRGGTALLFDEFEDMIAESAPSDDDWFAKRTGSKVFVNRLLETNPLPVIWTTNAIGNVDAAILRRMIFVLRMDRPAPAAARAMLVRIAGEEGLALHGALETLVARVPAAASVLRPAVRAGRLSGGGEAAAVVATETLVTAIAGRGALIARDADAFDPALIEIDGDLPALLDRVTADRMPRDFSLLLTGPPGTGKTGLARHLADRLERPLIVKRGSDLLSKWVGGTEESIAEAFAEAVASDGVLLFDEVDSILADRSTAQHSWEVTQVNELLTWFERHPLPFVAATNHGHRIDPAALRRFVFKLELRPLSGARAAAAFARFFGMPAPDGFGAAGGVTPGDLAVVRRQCRFLPTPPDVATIAALVAREVAMRPETGARIGF